MEKVMTADDKAFLLQELIRVYRCLRAGIAVTEAEHAWIDQQCVELQAQQIAEARKANHEQRHNA